MKEYYIVVAGEKRGPYSLSQLRDMWKSGAITMDTKYASQGMTSWADIGELMEPRAEIVLITCPACSAIHQKKREACPSCGWIRLHSKYKKGMSPLMPPTSPPGPKKKRKKKKKKEVEEDYGIYWFIGIMLIAFGVVYYFLGWWAIIGCVVVGLWEAFSGGGGGGGGGKSVSITREVDSEDFGL